MAQWFKDLACHCCGTSSIPGNFLILRPWPKKRKRKEKKKKKKDSLGSSLASSLLNLTKDPFGHPEHSLSVTKFREAFSLASQVASRAKQHHHFTLLSNCSSEDAQEPRVPTRPGDFSLGG